MPTCKERTRKCEDRNTQWGVNIHTRRHQKKREREIGQLCKPIAYYNIYKKKNNPKHLSLEEGGRRQPGNDDGKKFHISRNNIGLTWRKSVGKGTRQLASHRKKEAC